MLEPSFNRYQHIGRCRRRSEVAYAISSDPISARIAAVLPQASIPAVGCPLSSSVVSARHYSLVPSRPAPAGRRGSTLKAWAVTATIIEAVPSSATRRMEGSSSSSTSSATVSSSTRNSVDNITNTMNSSNNGDSRTTSSDIDGFHLLGGLSDNTSSPATASPLPVQRPMVQLHVVVPRCTTLPGEHLVLVGDCEALGRWNVRKGLRLHWRLGHMHTATFSLPADWQTGLRAKLVLVHRDAGRVTWEGGHDRSIVLQPSPTPSSLSSPSAAPQQGDTVAASGHNGKGDSNGNGRKAGTDPASTSGSSRGEGSGAGASDIATTRPAAASSSTSSLSHHDYVVICHWGHTDSTSVLARELPGEIRVLERQLSEALRELRTARAAAAAASQERLQRMAQDLAVSERAARRDAEQLAELQAKYSAMAAELKEARRQAQAAAAEATQAAAAATAAAEATSERVAEAEARVSQRYQTRMAELRQQLEGAKGAYAFEVAALQSQLAASREQEVEAREMAATLQEIVQKDVARLRAELAQLVHDYVGARQQLQEQAQQMDATERLRMQQVEGLSSEIKGLIAKYNAAQTTVAEQQRLLEELQACRGATIINAGGVEAPVQHLTIPPGPAPQAGNEWRSDWARLRRLTAAPASAPAAASA